MNRRAFLGASCAAFVLPLPALADDRVFYTPGLAEEAMAAGKVVFLDFWTNWCSTCATRRPIAGTSPKVAQHDSLQRLIQTNHCWPGRGNLIVDHVKINIR